MFITKPKKQGIQGPPKSPGTKMDIKWYQVESKSSFRHFNSLNDCFHHFKALLFLSCCFARYGIKTCTYYSSLGSGENVRGGCRRGKQYNISHFQKWGEKVSRVPHPLLHMGCIKSYRLAEISNYCLTTYITSKDSMEIMFCESWTTVTNCKERNVLFRRPCWRIH